MKKRGFPCYLLTWPTRSAANVVELRHQLFESFEELAEFGDQKDQKLYELQEVDVERMNHGLVVMRRNIAAARANKMV